MRAGDVIAACASSLGHTPGGRAIVRLSGPGTFNVLARVLCRVDDPHAKGRGDTTRGVTAEQLSVRAVRVARLRMGPGELPCLLMTFVGPASYTGEDSAELLVPANPAVVERVMQVLLESDREGTVSDVRVAGPGEFTARAFVNGRLSLAQAEGVAAMIGARSHEEHAAAQRLLAGTMGATYREWSHELSTLLSLVEAGIDFTDQEDVIAIDTVTLQRRLYGLTDAVRAMTGERSGSTRDEHRPVVVLAGRPNAGKSTLFNALLGRDRAVTSPLAGTTRDVIREELNLTRESALGDVCVLCDVAGLEQPSGTDGRSLEGESVETQMQSLAISAIRSADVVLWCDPAGTFEGGGARSTSSGETFTPHAGQRIIRVRTKGDLPNVGVKEGISIPVCALDGWNLGVLRRAIADAAWATVGNQAAGATHPSRTSSENAAKQHETLAGLPRHRRVLAATSNASTPRSDCSMLRTHIQTMPNAAHQGGTLRQILN